MPLDQSKRQIGIDTPLGANVLVLRNFTATEELGRLFQIDAELLSENFQISFPQIVGQNVTIRLNTIQSGQRLFNGHVRSFRQTGAVGRLARYHAVIVPKVWFLTRSADCRIFQNKKVPDIVKEVLQERGITEIEDTLTASYPQWEYCVQYRETDFNFISRLMEQEGIHYYFKHAQGTHTLVLADGDSSHPTFPGYADMSFHQEGLGVVNLQGIKQWAMTQEVQAGNYVLNDYDFEKPKTSLKAPANIDRQNVEANHELYDYPGEYDKFDDGKRYARMRIEEVQSDFEIAEGSGDVRGVAAGFKAKINGLPRSDQIDDYLVVSTVTRAESEGFLSEGGADDTGAFSGSFTAVRAKTPFHPARLTPKPIIQGAQTAVVTGPKGEEIYTDKYGRVKVQFHWDRKGKKDENTTCFIRVAEPWAGKNWGSVCTPRIGQEVVVNFLEGDPDQPLIIGSVYNGEQMPPYELPKHKTLSGIKSRSTLGGSSPNFNEIRFEDKKGEEQVFINAEKDMDLRVENDSREFIGKDRHLIVKANQTELVEANKHGHIKGNIVEKIDGDLSLTVGGKRQEKIGTVDTVEAGQEIHLKAGMKVIIEAGMQISLVGPGGFVDIGPSGVTIQGTMVLINSGGAAGSGSESSPDSPKDPDVADDGTKRGKLN
jgi:type VI secretion system secreted protein VgrG